MELPKLPSQLSNDELEELLKSPEETVTEPTQEIIRFLTAFNIQPGKSKVLPKLLYSIYKKWSKNPSVLVSFTKELVKYIHYDGKYCYISMPAFTLSEKALAYFKPKRPRKIASKQWHRHFKNFIKHYDLKPGTFWIEHYVLYYLYDNWVHKIRKTSHMGRIEFRVFLGTYFKINTRQGVSYVCVDNSLLTRLPQEHIDQIRSGYQLHEKRQKSKPKIRR